MGSCAVKLTDRRSGAAAGSDDHDDGLDIAGAVAAEFVEQVRVQPELEPIRRTQATWVWVFCLIGDLVSLWVNVGPASAFIQCQFPRANLAPGSDLPELVTQLRNSLAIRQVSATRMEVANPQPGPARCPVWSGHLDLKGLVTQYEADPAKTFRFV